MNKMTLSSTSSEKTILDNNSGQSAWPMECPCVVISVFLPPSLHALIFISFPSSYAFNITNVTCFSACPVRESWLPFPFHCINSHLFPSLSLFSSNDSNAAKLTGRKEPTVIADRPSSESNIDACQLISRPQVTKNTDAAPQMLLAA